MHSHDLLEITTPHVQPLPPSTICPDLHHPHKHARHVHHLCGPTLSPTTPPTQPKISVAATSTSTFSSSSSSDSSDSGGGGSGGAPEEETSLRCTHALLGSHS
uniref:Uncharacterized protein n=1 Tax=Nelumbo nucifera TaxID=4432 RepID=A0A822ZZ45_NELNU|nr:TPA_asm: hypothetical protein HUJ06_018033 [Nelumbo nucifera]